MPTEGYHPSQNRDPALEPQARSAVRPYLPRARLAVGALPALPGNQRRRPVPHALTDGTSEGPSAAEGAKPRPAA
jgi:hypothetical protein